MIGAEGARLVEEGFDAYLETFNEITRRAGDRFVGRQWRQGMEDAARRLDLYGERVNEVVAGFREFLGPDLARREVWASTRDSYTALISTRDDVELAETFFNSITRRVFSTVGVDPEIEFLGAGPGRPSAPGDQVYVEHPVDDMDTFVHGVLRRHGPDGIYRDIDSDARAVAGYLRSSLDHRPARSQFLDAVFYRRKGAYLIGRLEGTEGWIPLVLALVNSEEGMAVDAVLVDSDDVSILFSFTRSHFHVDLSPAREVIRFLRTLMPRKRIAELYIAIGHHKHGKTELYRDLMRYLSASEGRFDLAPGTPGLVMVTFAMPGHDLVFKVIRDVFPPEKRVTRQGVQDKYRMVFHHDRAGRLVEAQEFEHLRLHRSRFEDRLLEELLAEAGRTVRVDHDYVVIDHLYIERRVNPLDVYLGQATPKLAEDAVVDYGMAIEELASTGVFPGDLLIKNFGVTRHGRVVSYDYDELSLLHEMTFRDFPTPTSIHEELADEPWYGVGTDDVFPEEFRRFLGLNGRLRQVFEERWSHLFTASFWTRMQERLAAGEIVDIRPYRDETRLRSIPVGVRKATQGFGAALDPG